jgi:hypothetical protein
LKKVWVLAALLCRDGLIEQLATQNSWLEEFRTLQPRFESALSVLNRVRYHGSERVVELGDRIRVWYFFSRRAGRVAYVPGLSKPHSEIEFGGLFRVGVDIPGQTFMAIHVDPNTLQLKRGVTFVDRDTSPIPDLPTQEEFEL